MIADVVTATRARAFAFQAGIALLISVIFASMTFNLFGFKASFLFAPLIVLFLWPNGADAAMSYVAIFIASLLLDFLTGAPLGGWAVLYLPVFAILSQFSRGGELGFAESFFGFLMAISAFTVFFILCEFVNMLNVDLWGLLKSALVCLFLFPLVFMLKDKLRLVLVGEDD